MHTRKPSRPVPEGQRCNLSCVPIRPGMIADASAPWKTMSHRLARVSSPT